MYTLRSWILGVIQHNVNNISTICDPAMSGKVDWTIHPINKEFLAQFFALSQPCYCY